MPCTLFIFADSLGTFSMQCNEAKETEIAVGIYWKKQAKQQ